MKYSKELIAKVKEVYPDYTELHNLADKGNEFLGRYLDDNSDDGISSDEILQANTLEELQDKAKLLKQRQDCYAMWLIEYRQKYNL